MLKLDRNSDWHDRTNTRQDEEQEQQNDNDLFTKMMVWNSQPVGMQLAGVAWQETRKCDNKTRKKLQICRWGMMIATTKKRNDAMNCFVQHLNAAARQVCGSTNFCRCVMMHDEHEVQKSCMMNMKNQDDEHEESSDDKEEEDHED